MQINPVEYIFGLERGTNKFNLENITKILKELGNPEKDLKFIHVAGTNGKGSTCAMINACLLENDNKVGLFTSPHLARFNERIKINNKEINDEDLERLTTKIKKIKDERGINISFFEAATAIAYLYFKENNVDCIVLEVGLGGRLDATNTIIPEISVITQIGLEHKEILGRTIEKIAFEKSGIIKKNVKTITNNKGKALNVIKNRCEEIGSELIVAKKKKLETSLKGEYQKENASLAYCALKELGISDEVIRKGLLKARWPGRFDFIEENILVDSAHNGHGMRALVDSVPDREIILIFGVCEDKDVGKMVKLLKKLRLKKVILSKSDVKKAMVCNELKRYFNDAVVIEDVNKALEYAKKIRKDELILVCGSIYLIGKLYARE